MFFFVIGGTYIYYVNNTFSTLYGHNFEVVRKSIGSMGIRSTCFWTGYTMHIFFLGYL